MQASAIFLVPKSDIIYAFHGIHGCTTVSSHSASSLLSAMAMECTATFALKCEFQVINDLDLI